MTETLVHTRAASRSTGPRAIMGHMPAPQQPIELGPAPAPEEVVEFGAPPQRRRRWSSTGLLRQLTADRRMVPVAAALAAVAVFASLVSEWQLTTVDRAGFT